MKRFAIDIVLLPPDPVLDRVLEWNSMLCKTRPATIALDKKHYLPHISIVMGCLSEDRLEQANTILQSIAIQHNLLELQAPYISTVDTASGNSVVSLDIDLSPELVRVHETIVRAFRPLLTQDTIEADMHDPPPIDSSSLNWINHFIPNYCFQHYWPHITLGFGEPPGHFQPFTFQASRLAICHLGNHCTCRKILAEVLLKPRI
jgi:hypothetical protein